MSAPIARAAEQRRFSTPGGIRSIWFAVVAFVLAVLVPLLLVAENPDVGRSPAWILTGAVLVYAGVRLSWVIARGEPRLFDFFFFVFVYVFMGLAPTVQIRSGTVSTTTPGIGSDLDLPTAVIVVVGLACYEVGRVVAGRRRRAEPPPGAAPSVRPQSRVGNARAIVLLVLGVALSAYFVSRVGLGSLFESRDQAYARRVAVWPDAAVSTMFYALAVYPLLVGVGAVTEVRRSGSRATRSWYTALIVVGAGLLLVIINPISSARYSLGTVVFALVVFAGALSTSVRVRATMSAAIFGLIFLFPIADAFRRPAVSAVRTSFFGEYRGNADYDAFWQIANAYAYVNDGLVQPGRQALGSLLFWVPRALYPDKPLDTGILLANYRGYSFTNLSAPLWAELLVNGGIAVVVIGFLVLGYALRAMDRRLVSAFGDAGFWAIVGAIFPVYMVILLRGSLLQATGAVAVAVVCLLAVRRRGGSAVPELELSPRTLRRGPERSSPSRSPRAQQQQPARPSGDTPAGRPTGTAPPE